MDLFAEKGKRPPNWGYGGYKAQYDVFSRALTASAVFPAGRPIVQGATWCSPRWKANWSDYVSTYASSLATLSLHTYAESVCNGDVATVEGLLADKAAAGHAADMAPYAQVAAAHGVKLRIGEGNSVSCGGKKGVSDVWASALWVVDVLFNMAAVGVRGWHFHGGPDGAYATISYPNVSSDADIEVRPMYYGLLAFVTATANASVVMRVDTVRNDNPFVKAWAVTDASGATRVVVIHKDPSPTAGDAAVSITPPVALTGDARLTRALPGPAGVLATFDAPLSFGGLSWASTTDGTPKGTPTTEAVPAAGGAYAFTLPRASFAILALPAQ